MLKQYHFFTSIQETLSLTEEELFRIVKTPAQLVTDISKHLLSAGGKRLRPALYLLCAKSKGQKPAEMLAVSVALELIHMATLVHDDVIDESSTRRGMPTANVIWGNHAAVLTGDHLFAKAFSLVAEHGTSPMIKIMTDIVGWMCEGEILQLTSLFDPDQSVDDYLLRIQRKTADFIAASCQLGAMSAGYTAQEIEALTRYGHCLGMAFQLTDDILDITKSTAELGKPAGHDLLEGILTLPVLFALAESPFANELRQLILQKNFLPDQLTRALHIVTATDAISYSYRQVDAYLQNAKDVLKPYFSSELRCQLETLADYIAARQY